MKHLGLFEGIGGFSLAARWAGWETVAWCEWNEFGQKVLRHHFPEAEGFGDITKTDFKKYANRIDIVTGGFPCQPYSSAGKRKGKDDERHLWPEMLRAIREIQPSYVVGENVRGLTNWNGGLVFDEVQADLEAIGYEVLPFLLPACAVNAPHRRDRIWFIAYSHRCADLRRSAKNESQGSEERLQKRDTIRQFTESGGLFGTTSDTNSDGHELRGLGEDRPEKGEGETNQRERERIRDNVGGIGQSENVADTERNGLEYRQEPRSLSKSKAEARERFARHSEAEGWAHFPTQSPICGGDDGLPRELDSITFPKWRNESLKAYGNAIVPQIAYEIFKVINKMEL